MLDFPGSPSTGDVYPTSGPPAWRFNGVGWQRINVITQLEDNGFWSNYGGDINRLGRVFIGAATQNTGDAPESTPDPIEQVRSFSVLSQLAVVSRVGLTAIYGGTRSSDWATDNSFSTIGVAGISLNDDVTHTMVAYGGFFHGYHYDGAWYTVGQEIDIANFGVAPDVTPYDITPAHSSVGQILASSGAVAGTTDASAAQLIRNDGSAFKKGIVFEDDALTLDGGGYGVAIEFATNQGIQWLPAGGQPVQMTSYGAGSVDLAWADAGSSGLHFTFFTDSPSPAALDLIASLVFYGNDSAANAQDYAYLQAFILDPTSGSEDSMISLLTTVAGSVVNAASVANGMVIGTPTGGFKGNGTINAAGDIYKNNTAYTNPDYALEKYFTGSIERFADKPGAAHYAGLVPLDDLEDRLRSDLRLPGINDEPAGIFERSDRALEKIEEAWIYALELHNRVKALEGRA